MKNVEKDKQLEEEKRQKVYTSKDLIVNGLLNEFIYTNKSKVNYNITDKDLKEALETFKYFIDDVFKIDYVTLETSVLQ